MIALASQASAKSAGVMEVSEPAQASPRSSQMMADGQTTSRGHSLRQNERVSAILTRASDLASGVVRRESIDPGIFRCCNY